MKRICIFGDSITWGMGLSERAGWADLLRNYLEEKSDYYLELYSLGIDRDSSTELLARIESESKSRKPDLIVIDIGTNDSLEFQRDGIKVQFTSEEVFRNNLQRIIDISKTFTNEVIFIGLCLGDESLTNPLPRSTTGKRYTKDRVGIYNSIISDVTSRNNVAFVDIIGLLSDDDFIDGLHPNLSGHQKIFERIISLRGSYFEERNTIVDENDNVIGAKIRKDITLSDIYRVAGLWLRNDQGQVLLARRALSKSHDPGKWGPAVAGTVIEGEDYLATMKREAYEELGLDDLTFEIGPKKLIKGQWWQYYSQKFYATTNRDILDMKIQKDEVEEIKWFDEATLPELIREKPEMFVGSMQNYID
jgi:isopentenyl-diphosphate Delta-isomerase